MEELITRNLLTWNAYQVYELCDYFFWIPTLVYQGHFFSCIKITVNFMYSHLPMGFAVRVRSAGQKYGPTCHQRDRADVTEFVTLVRLSSLGQHVGVLALAGYKRRKSAPTANPIGVLPIFPSCITWDCRYSHVSRSHCYSCILLYLFLCFILDFITQ